MIQRIKTRLYMWLLYGSLPDATSPWAAVIVFTMVVAIMLVAALVS